MRKPTRVQRRKLTKIYKAVARGKRKIGRTFKATGFVILHSRLIFRPPVLIVGMQPMGAPSPQDTVQEAPPKDDRFALHRGHYKLAVMTTGIFARAERCHMLRHAQFFDANFFRDLTAKEFPRYKEYQKATATLCAPFVRALIKLIKPGRIITLGGPAALALVPKHKRLKQSVMDRMGPESFRPSYNGIPVIPLCHPMGAGTTEDHLRAAIECLRRDLADAARCKRRGVEYGDIMHISRKVKAPQKHSP